MLWPKLLNPGAGDCTSGLLSRAGPSGCGKGILFQIFLKFLNNRILAAASAPVVTGITASQRTPDLVIHIDRFLSPWPGIQAFFLISVGG